MRTSKYSDEQIIDFLRQAEVGMPIKEIGRKHGFRLPAFTSGAPSTTAWTPPRPNGVVV